MELEATVGGRRLRVTRRPEQVRPKRSGAGLTAEPASVRLAELTAAGEWESKSTRIGEVDAEIEQLMGMSAAQFFQVVLLPQGEFARFLRADAKDKEALLQKLFGTDRFRRAEDWLADRRRAGEKDVAAGREEVARLVAQVAQAAGVPVPDDPAEPAAWAAGLAGQAASGRDDAARLVWSGRADLDTALAASAAAGELAGRQRRRQDALARQRELQAAVPEIAALGADATALRTAGQRHQSQAGQLSGLRAVLRQADAEDATATGARDRAAQLSADIGQGEARARQRREDRDQAERLRAAASDAAASLPAAQAQADRAHRVAADCAALVREHARRGGLHQAHLDAREAHQVAQDESLRVREARIDGMRAELAAQMTDDSPCPVCGSRDHPDPVDPGSFPPVTRDEEDAAVGRAADAAEAAQRAGAELAAADAVLADLAQRLSAAGQPLPPAPGKPAPADTTSLADLSNTSVLADLAKVTHDEAEGLEAEAARLRDTAATLTTRQRELDQLDQAIAAGQAGLSELAVQHQAALDESAAADTRAARHRAELAGQLGGATDLEAAIKAATRLGEAFTDAAAIADLLAAPDLAVPLDPPAPVDQAAEAVAAAQRSHDVATAAYGTARHRAEQLDGLRPRLADALAALQPVRERAARIRHLADLANGTASANQYKMTLSSFVLAARLEEVAAAASERLLTMTAGRYRLVHSDARKGNAKAGLSLLACDAWTGVDRDTATLSGGETFLASLALALGLADTVTAESAGTRMEALFVDEGFGTLDEETLDEVMNVLDGLRAGGRMVGIVSHVSELRQRIPARVHVRKTRSGSHVEVTAG